jgi:single-strand DNA-binding protein
MGNLGQDPELKRTGNGKAVTTLSIATSEYTRGEDGQAGERTEWHRVVVWDKQAESCVKYLKKGRQVFVEGRLATRSWEDEQGNRRFVTEIIASNVVFIGGAPAQDRVQEPARTSDVTLEPTDDSIPF